MARRNAYLLAGATASGKSAVAALLAREMGAAILNADSMLVYRGMDIGTAKPSPAERAEFRMGGIDLVTPAEEFSAGAWLRAAAAWAATVPAETPIVIAGGTGLYFSALLRGLDRAWTKPPPEYPVLQIDRAVVRARIAAGEPCAICGQPIDLGMPQTYVDPSDGRRKRAPWSWEVDEIVPLARGGSPFRSRQCPTRPPCL